MLPFSGLLWPVLLLFSSLQASNAGLRPNREDVVFR